MSDDRESEGWASYAAEQERHSQLREVARRVVMDFGDACDHPADCDCSMAQLVRLVETTS